MLIISGLQIWQSSRHCVKLNFKVDAKLFQIRYHTGYYRIYRLDLTDRLAMSKART